MWIHYVFWCINVFVLKLFRVWYHFYSPSTIPLKFFAFNLYIHVVKPQDQLDDFIPNLTITCLVCIKTCNITYIYIYLYLYICKYYVSIFSGATWHPTPMPSGLRQRHTFTNCQAETMDFEVKLPETMQRAPFDWQHAQLEPLRELLLDAQRKGQFVPQPGLPL